MTGMLAADILGLVGFGMVPSWPVLVAAHPLDAISD